MAGPSLVFTFNFFLNMDYLQREARAQVKRNAGPYWRNMRINPVGIWCQNGVVSTLMRRHDVASTLVWRHFTAFYGMSLSLIGLQGYQKFSCSTQLSMQFQRLISIKISRDSHIFRLILDLDAIFLLINVKGRFLKFRIYHNFVHLFSK